MTRATAVASDPAVFNPFLPLPGLALPIHRPPVISLPFSCAQRVRETLGDDVAMLRLLQSAMWVLLPACSAVVAWRMSRPMWGIGMAEEARLSGEVGVYLALVVLVFLTLSVGTRLSRVLSEQR